MSESMKVTCLGLKRACDATVLPTVSLRQLKIVALCPRYLLAPAAADLEKAQAKERQQETCLVQMLGGELWGGPREASNCRLILARSRALTLHHSNFSESFQKPKGFVEAMLGINGNSAARTF